MDREWETIQNYNIGLDFGLFGNRLKGTAELFWKVCENMLIDVSYPATLGDKAPTATWVALRQTVLREISIGRTR